MAEREVAGATAMWGWVGSVASVRDSSRVMGSVVWGRGWREGLQWGRICGIRCQRRLRSENGGPRARRNSRAGRGCDSGVDAGEPRCGSRPPWGRPPRGQPPSDNLLGANLSGTDLRRADLSEADLNGANLRQANLSRANLSGAFLLLAIFSFADLSDADVSDADLTGTDLSGADLSGANLSNSVLSDADLSQAIVGSTTFGRCDLSQVSGLETVRHEGPSSVGTDTLLLTYRGAGNRLTPELRGFFIKAGVPAPLLEAIPTIASKVRYHSAFIAYGEPDRAFAKLLYTALQSNGVSCWTYAMDATQVSGPGMRSAESGWKPESLSFSARLQDSCGMGHRRR